jgi:hypothetical protein
MRSISSIVSDGTAVHMTAHADSLADAWEVLTPELSTR